MNKLKQELYNLLESETTIFDFVQETSLDGLWYWNLENPEEGWINDKFWITLGYDPSDMVGEVNTWLELINPDDLILAKQNFEKHIANPKHSIEQTIRYTHKNGSLVWLKIKGMTIRNEQGVPVRMLGVHINVTEEKRIEVLLADTNRVAKVGSWEVDLITNKVFWSTVTRVIHEVESDFVPDVATGINFYKEGESRETITQCIEKAMTTGEPWDVELQLVTAKGNEVWVRAVGEAEFFEGQCIRLFGVFQDIDERVTATIEHTKTLERLTLATDAAQIGIWDYDVVNNNLIWDDHMYQLYGIKKTDFQGVYEAWTAGVHPDDMERGNKEIEMALADKKPFNTEFRVVWPSGEVKHIRAIATVKRNAAGEGVRITGVNWDITSRRESENQLRESEERFRQMFENAPIGIGLVDTKGKWMKVNDSFLKMSGYTFEELQAGEFHSLTHPDDLEKSLYYAKEINKGNLEKYQFELRYINKKGKTVWVILAVSSVKNKDGKTIYYVVQVIDISEKKKAEDLIVKERAFLQTLIDNLPVNVFVKDLELRKTLLNRKELEFLGITDITDVIGKSDHDLYPKAIADMTKAEELEVINSGEGFVDKEALIIKENGEKSWFLTSKIPLKDADGNVTGILGISYNITKHKLAEEKLRQFSILKSKSKEMEQFAYVASHDLREPLLTIRGYTELLQEDFSENLDKDGQQILGYIQNAVNRMDALIHGLLDYSRLSQVKQLQTVNLSQVLKDVEEDLTAVMKNSNAILCIDELPQLLAYPLEIKLLFQNLISNAIKFKNLEKSPEIHVSSRKVEKGWEFSVKDNGIGIEKRNIKKIFNIFSRLHSKDLYPGTGIGLANCKKIVELHNGTIWVESTPEKGSTFYFTILTDI